MRSGPKHQVVLDQPGAIEAQTIGKGDFGQHGLNGLAVGTREELRLRDLEKQIEAHRAAKIQSVAGTEESYPGLRVRVGAVGWDWDEPRLYPDDLPPEWRLAYFNTQFECVYLPVALWQGRSPVDLKGWVDDTLERFRFVVEMPARLGEDDKARIAALKPRLGMTVNSGVPPTGGLIWIDGTPDLRKLADGIRIAAGEHEALYLISRTHDIKAMNQVKTLVGLMGI